ncbi:MAG TPA: hypothetical protein VH186_34820 [Chloroflexia bacterium]|nr:hypothetical protein [Chloroflexia bacterium]
MIAVISTGKLKSGLEDKVKEFTGSRFISELEKVAGINSICVGYSREKGEMATVIQWESREALEAGRNSQKFQSIFLEALEYLEPGSFTRNEYEILS